MQMGEKGAGKEVPLCVETEGSTMFDDMMQCNAMQCTLVVTGVWVVGGEERETETRDKRTPTNIVT